ESFPRKDDSTGAAKAAGEVAPRSRILTGLASSRAQNLRAERCCFRLYIIPTRSETVSRITHTMTRPNSLPGTRPQRTRKATTPPERKHHSRRSRLRFELLEDRTTPSVNPATPLELDGNVTTTTAHDWDQIFADASPLTNGDGTFSNGPTSGALAG